MKISVTLQEFDGDIHMPFPDELLAELGVTAGDQVDVRAENGQLIIVPIAPSSAPAEPGDDSR